MSGITNKLPDFHLEGFTLLNILGSGSYSTVYRSLRTVKEKEEIVAVKCVNKNKLSKSGLENIINEIKLMKMLHHPFIVKMIDFLWDDRNIYIILEYCDGGDLSTFIKKKRKLPEKVCQKFLVQLALGLRFLRSHNIAHLDLKPQNLLLLTQPSLTLKIADFGFAQFLSDDTKKFSMRGSPLYMAPEMLLKHEYGPIADLWSVGIIAYQCLFGKAPLPSNTCHELVGAVKSQMPIEVPQGSVSEECRDLINNLLVYDPNKRLSYDKFFNHAFLDLEHYPSEESYNKAVRIVLEAVKLDGLKKYESAFDMYCEALSYLVPYVNWLEPGEKKERCYLKVLEYTKRAEELKVVLYKFDVNKLDKPKRKAVQQAQQKNPDTASLLLPLCGSTPNMTSAVEIGNSAQMYLVEGNYEMAMEKFKSSLGILVPLLSTEPPGTRRDILSTLVQEWLKKAECVKTLLTVRDCSLRSLESTELPVADHCVIQ